MSYNDFRSKDTMKRLDEVVPGWRDKLSRVVEKHVIPADQLDPDYEARQAYLNSLEMPRLSAKIRVSPGEALRRKLAQKHNAKVVADVMAKGGLKKWASNEEILARLAKESKEKSEKVWLANVPVINHAGLSGSPSSNTIGMTPIELYKFKQQQKQKFAAATRARSLPEIQEQQLARHLIRGTRVISFDLESTGILDRTIDAFGSEFLPVVLQTGHTVSHLGSRTTHTHMIDPHGQYAGSEEIKVNERYMQHYELSEAFDKTKIPIRELPGSKRLNRMETRAKFAKILGAGQDFILVTKSGKALDLPLMSDRLGIHLGVPQRQEIDAIARRVFPGEKVGLENIAKLLHLDIPEGLHDAGIDSHLASIVWEELAVRDPQTRELLKQMSGITDRSGPGLRAYLDPKEDVIIENPFVKGSDPLSPLTKKEIRYMKHINHWAPPLDLSEGVDSSDVKPGDTIPTRPWNPIIDWDTPRPGWKPGDAATVRDSLKVRRAMGLADEAQRDQMYKRIKKADQSYYEEQRALEEVFGMQPHSSSIGRMAQERTKFWMQVDPSNMKKSFLENTLGFNQREAEGMVYGKTGVIRQVRALFAYRMAQYELMGSLSRKQTANPTGRIVSFGNYSGEENALYSGMTGSERTAYIIQEQQRPLIEHMSGARTYLKDALTGDIVPLKSLNSVRLNIPEYSTPKLKALQKSKGLAKYLENEISQLEILAAMEKKELIGFKAKKSPYGKVVVDDFGNQHLDKNDVQDLSPDEPLDKIQERANSPEQAALGAEGINKDAPDDPEQAEAEIDAQEEAEQGIEADKLDPTDSTDAADDIKAQEANDINASTSEIEERKAEIQGDADRAVKPRSSAELTQEISSDMSEAGDELLSGTPGAEVSLMSNEDRIAKTSSMEKSPGVVKMTGDAQRDLDRMHAAVKLANKNRAAYRKANKIPLKKLPNTNWMGDTFVREALEELADPMADKIAVPGYYAALLKEAKARYNKVIIRETIFTKKGDTPGKIIGINTKFHGKILTEEYRKAAGLQTRDIRHLTHVDREHFYAQATREGSDGLEYQDDKGVWKKATFAEIEDFRHFQLQTSDRTDSKFFMSLQNKVPERASAMQVFPVRGKYLDAPNKKGMGIYTMSGAYLGETVGDASGIATSGYAKIFKQGKGKFEKYRVGFTPYNSNPFFVSKYGAIEQGVFNGVSGDQLRPGEKPSGFGGVSEIIRFADVPIDHRLKESAVAQEDLKALYLGQKDWMHMPFMYDEETDQFKDMRYNRNRVISEEEVTKFHDAENAAGEGRRLELERKAYADSTSSEINKAKNARVKKIMDFLDLRKKRKSNGGSAEPKAEPSWMAGKKGKTGMAIIGGLMLASSLIAVAGAGGRGRMNTPDDVSGSPYGSNSDDSRMFGGHQVDQGPARVSLMSHGKTGYRTNIDIETTNTAGIDPRELSRIMDQHARHTMGTSSAGTNVNVTDDSDKSTKYDLKRQYQNMMRG